MANNPESAGDVLIRLATKNDMPSIVRMARKFWEVSGATYIDFDVNSIEKTAEFLIDSDSAVLLIADDGSPCGMAGAMLHPSYMNSKHLTGQELFWWVDEEKRGSKIGVEMYEALERWVIDKGANSFTMVALEAQSPEIVSRFYERKSYKLIERHFNKVF